MADEYTLDVKRFTPQDSRLGRHVVHDSRSRRFSAPARSPATLKSTRHTVHIPIMDQGDVGSCTGHAGTNVLASQAFWAAGREPIGPGDPHVYAVHLYSDATAIDPWPGVYVPDDTGSDGLSIAKVLHARGLISGYEHAFSLEATLTALAERVVMCGTSWHESMYDVAPDGQITVRGVILGGHEFVLDELDTERGRVWMRNSWGDSWGLGGRAWFAIEDFGALLADQGDCTILVPLSAPAPEPTPVPPKPKRNDAPLEASLTRWLKTSGGPSYLRRDAIDWVKGNN